MNEKEVTRDPACLDIEEVILPRLSYQGIRNEAIALCFELLLQFRRGREILAPEVANFFRVVEGLEWQPDLGDGLRKFAVLS